MGNFNCFRARYTHGIFLSTAQGEKCPARHGVQTHPKLEQGDTQNQAPNLARAASRRVFDSSPQD